MSPQVRYLLVILAFHLSFSWILNPDWGIGWHQARRVIHLNILMKIILIIQCTITSQPFYVV